jgi:hypothetical protein
MLLHADNLDYTLSMSAIYKGLFAQQPFSTSTQKRIIIMTSTLFKFKTRTKNWMTSKFKYCCLLNLFSKRRCRMQLENLKIHGELRENVNLREYFINKLIIIIIKLLKKLIKKFAFKYTWMIAGKFSAWV